MTNTPSSSSSSTFGVAGIGTPTTTVWYVGYGSYVRIVTIQNSQTIEFVVSPAKAREHYLSMLKPINSNNPNNQFKRLSALPREEVLKIVDSLPLHKDHKCFFN